jgi:hypothetical protein
MGQDWQTVGSQRQHGLTHWFNLVTLISMLVIPSARKFNVAMLKSILLGESMLRFDDGSNLSGCFGVTYQQQFFYYITKKTRQVAYPSPNSTSDQTALHTGVIALAIPSIHARPNNGSTDDGTNPLSAVIVSKTTLVVDTTITSV